MESQNFNITYPFLNYSNCSLKSYQKTCKSTAISKCIILNCKRETSILYYTMKKYTWLKFPNNDKLNAFMRFTQPVWLDHTTSDLTIGYGFTKKEIEMAIKDFGARVIEKPALLE